jgi:recombination protein RecT
METTAVKKHEQQAPVTVKSLLSQDSYRNRFSEIMGKKATGFISSVINVSSSQDLAACSPNSVIMSAVVAATLDLPIDKNLGFAYIIAYKDHGNPVAQFQIGYKGFIQLAMRTGQYSRLTANVVYEGQLIKGNPFTDDFDFDFEAKKSDKVIGYVAYFRLVNGFEKYNYMTKEQVEKHGKKYSQTFKKGFGKWAEEFDSMALKTVIKLLLSKFGILSIEMQKALQADQAEILDADKDNIEAKYLDTENAAFEVVTGEPNEEDQAALLETIKGDKKKLDMALAKGEITSSQYQVQITELSLFENGNK